MGTKFDARAEELVLNMLHIHGHQFAMRAISSTNPDWDIVEFVEESNGSGTYKPHYYQVKGHNWNNSSKSHTINADFTKLKNDKKVECLFLVIFNHEEEPETYRFNLEKDIKEKQKGQRTVLFDESGALLYSEPNKVRGDDNRTISIGTFYDKKYSNQRKKHLNRWD